MNWKLNTPELGETKLISLSQLQLFRLNYVYEKTFVANLCSSDLILEPPKDKNAINYFIENCRVNFSEIENGTIMIEEGIEIFIKSCYFDED